MLSPQTVENLLETIGKQGDNKQAENQLMAFKPDPNYILCLMEVLQSSQSKMAQWVAAIEFKNTVASYWVRFLFSPFSYDSRRISKRSKGTTKSMPRLSRICSKLCLRNPEQWPICSTKGPSLSPKTSSLVGGTPCLQMLCLF